VTKEELRGLTKEEISRRIREGVKAIIEQVLEEEMTEHLAAGYRKRTLSRRGERNGHYTGTQSRRWVGLSSSKCPGQFTTASP